MRESDITRRQFLRASAGLAAAGVTFASLDCRADMAISSAARRLVDSSYVLDGTVQLGTKDGKWTMEPGGLKRLTGINAGGWTMREAVLGDWYEKVRRYSDAYTLIHSAADLREARATNKYGVIIYFQKDYEFNGNVGKLEQWYAKGLRAFQPTYSETNELGGGQNDDHTGLTPFGRRVIRECNRLGIVVDVSHCGRRTTLDVVDTSEFTVTANHCNADKIAPIRRNKSDEELRAIADSGGVIGVTAIGLFLRPDGSRATVGDFLDQIDYLVDLVGPAAVGIASDSFMDGEHNDRRWYSDKYLNSFERWYYVTQGLLDRGYDETTIRKILGENFFETYDAIL